jgi:hypothetical protein
MQVTPEAGKDTAKRFGVSYDWNRMKKDPVYNTQMGAGELSALLSEYKGSLIMTFAGYNAGRGRVRDWIKLRGDPRDPNVDAVDWVERIPFSETRNYVQRVIENLAVYRARFGTGTSAPAMAAKPGQAPTLAAKPEPTPALASSGSEPAPAPAAKPEAAPVFTAKPAPAPALAAKPVQAPALMAKPEQAPAPGPATAAAAPTTPAATAAAARADAPARASASASPGAQ